MAPRRKRAVKEVEKPVEVEVEEEEAEVEEEEEVEPEDTQMEEAEEEEEEEEEEEDETNGQESNQVGQESATTTISLQFKEPLSWRAGRPISTGDLLSRLDKLSKELSGMEQETCDSDSLTSVAKELAAQNLLGHKDKGVRALTACCLVDILSLSAPDAPFTPNQLKDIFTLFITSILPALSDPSNAYNVQHMYVLNSLAEVKSIILLADIPNADSLILHLFVLFFDMLRGGPPKSSKGDQQMSKAVEYNMAILLVTLVDEAASLPSQVIDTIISQFLRASSVSSKSKQVVQVDNKQATLLAKDFSPSYRLAKKICDDCPEKMSRYISQYFNEVILDASSAGDGDATKSRKSNADLDSSDEEGEPAGPSDADLKELDKAHNLLRELWRASSPVLQNVIPQLEAELSAENVNLRLLATETLGDIISGIGAAGPPPAPQHDPAAYPPIKLSDPQPPLSDSALLMPMSPESFPQTYHQVYLGFMQRRLDKSPIIRAGWATACGRILATSAGGIGLSRDEEHTLVTALAERLGDSEEKVRLAAIRAVATFSFHDIVTKMAAHGDMNKQGSLLCCLADRIRDRKSSVRAEGMVLVAKLWGVAAGEIIAGEESVVAALGAIPRKLYELVFVNDAELNVLLEHVTFEQMAPLNFPPVKKGGNNNDIDVDKIRTERILTLIDALEGKSKQGFFNLQKRSKDFRKAMEGFLQMCDKYNGGVGKGDDPQIRAPLKATIDWFCTVAPDKIRAAQDLWKFAKLHDRRCYQLVRFMMAPESDYQTMYKALKEFTKKIEANPAAPAGMMETLLPILYRCGSIFFNKSHLPTILAYARQDEDAYNATAHEILKQVSDVSPQVFKAQIKELCEILEEQTPSADKANDHGSVQTLKACASYARKYPKEIPSDRKFIKSLINFAEYGVPPKSAKYAVNVLIHATERKEMHAKDLLTRATKDFEYGSKHFLTKLATISQVALLMPKIVETFTENILEITTVQILLQAREAATEDDPQWQDDSDLDEECQAKCWCLKTLVNIVRSCAAEDLEQQARPVYRLLNTLVRKDGEIATGGNTPAHHRSRLRLYAAQMLLKLCAINKDLDRLLTAQDFINLSFIAQDPCYNVRAGFMEKLKKYLSQNRLSVRFYTIVFMIAFEPEPKLRSDTIAFVQARARSFQAQNRQILEQVLPRLISLLAHHPDYSAEAQDLLDTANYLLTYVSTVVTEDNLGLVYRYTERVKGLGDAITPEESERLYVLSDLVQAILRKWQLKKGWSMQAYAGNTGIPKDLFAPLPDHQTAQDIAEKSYIPDEMEDLLDSVIRRKSASKKQKRKSDTNGDAPAAKKVRTSVPRPQKVKSTPRKSKTSKSTTTPKSTVPDSERRRSGRGAAAKSTYADRDSSDDDEEMLDGVSKWEYEDGRIESGDESNEDESEDENMEEEGEEEENDDVANNDGNVSDVGEEEEASSETQAPTTNPKKGTESANQDTTEVSEAEAEQEEEEQDENVDELFSEEVNEKKGRTRGRAAATPVKSIIEPETGAEGDDEGDEPADLPAPAPKLARNKKVAALRKTKTPAKPVVESEADMPSRKSRASTRAKRASPPIVEQVDDGKVNKDAEEEEEEEEPDMVEPEAVGKEEKKTTTRSKGAEPTKKTGTRNGIANGKTAATIPSRTRSTRGQKAK